MTRYPVYGPYLPDGDGPALCRRFCRRLRSAAAARDFRRRSEDGLRLCRRFCKGFAAGRPMIVVRRRARGDDR